MVNGQSSETDPADNLHIKEGQEQPEIPGNLGAQTSAEVAMFNFLNSNDIAGLQEILPAIREELLGKLLPESSSEPAIAAEEAEAVPIEAEYVEELNAINQILSDEAIENIGKLPSRLESQPRELKHAHLQLKLLFYGILPKLALLQGERNQAGLRDEMEVSLATAFVHSWRVASRYMLGPEGLANFPEEFGGLFVELTGRSGNPAEDTFSKPIDSLEQGDSAQIAEIARNAELVAALSMIAEPQVVRVDTGDGTYQEIELEAGAKWYTIPSTDPTTSLQVGTPYGELLELFESEIADKNDQAKSILGEYIDQRKKALGLGDAGTIWDIIAQGGTNIPEIVAIFPRILELFRAEKEVA